PTWLRAGAGVAAGALPAPQRSRGRPMPTVPPDLPVATHERPASRGAGSPISQSWKAWRGPCCGASPDGARRGLILALALAITGCAEMARLPEQAGFGPDPQLPEPKTTLIPTVKVARVVGWGAQGTPVAADGLQVTAFARGLDHPRWLHVLPNGDVLVAESNRPPKADEVVGLKEWLMAKMMGRAGAGTPSADRITLLRDADGDGVAEMRSVFLEGLHSP